MRNPMHCAAMLAHPRCGAHARTTGQPCKSSAMKHGRCRMHGGKAGRKLIHGRRSRAYAERQAEVRALIRAMQQLLGLT